MGISALHRHLVDRGQRLHPASRDERDGIHWYLLAFCMAFIAIRSSRAPQRVVSGQRTTLTQHIYFLGYRRHSDGQPRAAGAGIGPARVRLGQGVVSADERSARRRRHRRLRRFRSRATESRAGSRRRSATRSCRAATPASSTCSTRACRIRPAPNGSAARFSTAAGCSRCRAHTARRRRRACSRTFSIARVSNPGFLIGGVPKDFGISARLGSHTVLRRRSRRIRHVVFRSPLEVRALPAAHARHQQPRVRPRRHLPGPRLDPDAIPSSAAHGAVRRSDRGAGTRRSGGPRACEWDAGRRSRAYAATNDHAKSRRSRRTTANCGARKACRPTDRSSRAQLNDTPLGEVKWSQLGQHNVSERFERDRGGAARRRTARGRDRGARVRFKASRVVSS